MSRTKLSRPEPPRPANPGEGLRRIELVVPDVRSPAFRAEAARQAAAVAASRQAREDQDFIEAAASFDAEG